MTLYNSRTLQSLLQISISSTTWSFKKTSIAAIFSFKTAIRPMSTANSNRDHLQVTSKQQRQEEKHELVVRKIHDISPTVKELWLTTDKRPVPFEFYAGQWL